MRDPFNELREIQDEGLKRSLSSISLVGSNRFFIKGREALSFSSNDYLGLSQSPVLKEAAQRAAYDYGVGSTSSRLINGSLQVHHELEEKLAEKKQAEAALVFSNGYMLAVGVIPALIRKGDTVIIDKLAHASLIDGARLAQQAGAVLRVYPHNHLERLEKILEKVRAKNPSGRILIITESVFSMDGDLCPLRDLVRLKDRYEALLFLDEAHGVGILGASGQGLAEQCGLQKEVDFQMGTFGKALGGAGGYLATSRGFADLLINRARSFIYSTAPPPAQSAVALAALYLLQSHEGILRRNQLQRNIAWVKAHLKLEGMNSLAVANSAIIPYVIGSNQDVLYTANRLFDRGVFVPAIRYPTVAKGSARLRISLNAMHTLQELKILKAHLNEIIEEKK